mmetsp:Transcript_2092/g.2658  ORF Transcript_2092/g.2658 Transcript_2092/m.2658 type:complete len:347 (-) Transcript_2092:367-1407(-)
MFADFSPIGFVSCSNDSMVKIWTYDGDMISELAGHSGYVFAVHTLPNNIIASGSDDRTVKLWKNFECVQTIDFPSTVWDIKSNTAGDLISACEDYKIYVFSRDPSKAATGTELTAFEVDLKAVNTAEKVDLGNLPSVDQISQYKGKKDGEIKIFKTATGGEAYTWNASNQKWDKFGDVQMPAAPPKEIKYYEGDRLFEAGEYDHIFDVEIGDGVMRKLPFNNGGNYDEAANKFCIRENFGKANIESIIKFLKTNSLPYATRDTTSRKEESKSKAAPELKSLPMRKFLFFDQVKAEEPKKKILEFNEELKSIEEKEMLAFNKLFAVIGDKKNYSTSQIYKQEWDVFK